MTDSAAKVTAKPWLQMFRHGGTNWIPRFARFTGSLRECGLDWDVRFGPVVLRRWWSHPYHQSDNTIVRFLFRGKGVPFQ